MSPSEQWAMLDLKEHGSSALQVLGAGATRVPYTLMGMANSAVDYVRRAFKKDEKRSPEADKWYQEKIVPILRKIK